LGLSKFHTRARLGLIRISEKKGELKNREMALRIAKGFVCWEIIYLSCFVSFRSSRDIYFLQDFFFFSGGLYQESAAGPPPCCC
jgi:hypothetical protein